jgi:hypothetical protein
MSNNNTLAETHQRFPTHEEVCLTSELHSTISQQEKKLRAPWLGTLPFCIDAYGDGNYSQHDNILDLMQNSVLTGHVMRFCPIKYPPNQKEGVDNLVRDLFLSAREHGVELVSGGGNRPPMCKSLVCSCSLLVKNNGKEQVMNKENESYRLAWPRPRINPRMPPTKARFSSLHQKEGAGV